MRYLRLFLILLPLFLISCSMGQDTKQEAEKAITSWYEKHPESYNLEVNGDELKLAITSYHPDENEAKNLIKIPWKGMEITLAFNLPLDSFEWTGESLQENLAYVVLDDIYSDIELNSWKVHPQTPQSSSSTALTFTDITAETISFTINWEIFTVFGYSQSKECQEAKQIADASMPEECFVGIEKRLPLKIDVTAKR